EPYHGLARRSVLARSSPARRDRFSATVMKSDLDHLPQAKREQIQRVVEIVRDGADVELVVLFGSHARGDWVRDPVHGYGTYLVSATAMLTSSAAARSRSLGRQKSERRSSVSRQHYILAFARRG